MQATKLQPTKEQIMQSWADRLRKWKLHQIAAAFLEAGGPLNVVGAQLVYLGQPILGSLLADEQMDTLATMLEEPGQTKTFIQYLREDEQ